MKFQLLNLPLLFYTVKFRLCTIVIYDIVLLIQQQMCHLIMLTLNTNRTCVKTALNM